MDSTLKCSKVPLVNRSNVKSWIMGRCIKILKDGNDTFCFTDKLKYIENISVFLSNLPFYIKSEYTQLFIYFYCVYKF